MLLDCLKELTELNNSFVMEPRYAKKLIQKSNMLHNLEPVRILIAYLSKHHFYIILPWLLPKRFENKILFVFLVFTIRATRPVQPNLFHLKTWHLLQQVQVGKRRQRNSRQFYILLWKWKC